MQSSPEAVGTFEAFVSSVIDTAVERAVEAALCKTREPDDALLDAQGAADLLALTKQSIEMMSKRRSHGLPFVKLPNGRIRFERAALLVWARSAS